MLISSSRKVVASEHASAGTRLWCVLMVPRASRWWAGYRRDLRHFEGIYSELVSTLLAAECNQHLVTCQDHRAMRFPEGE